jgi:hypothetical protein
MNIYIKQREIVFNYPQAEKRPAFSASLLLTGLHGIESVNTLTAERMLISYDIQLITYDEIEQVLQEIGYHLDNSLFMKLKRALYNYTEETERANLDCINGQCKCTRDVFVKKYSIKPHGCRDPRPEHWRGYL